MGEFGARTRSLTTKERLMIWILLEFANCVPPGYKTVQLNGLHGARGRGRGFGSWFSRSSNVQGHIIRLRLLWGVRSGTLLSMRKAITNQFL
jgi:hypothetical protein